MSTIPAVNFPPISTTPAVHLELPISSQIFTKIRGLQGYWGGGGDGEEIHEINLKKKARDTVPLKLNLNTENA